MTEIGQTGNVIAIRGLNFQVPEKHILKDISFEVKSGEILAVMGMSGCGKTTLLKCLAGLIRPSGGQILFQDTDIASTPERDMDPIRLRIGLVFQYAALFDSLNVYDNVSFGVKHHRRLRKAEMDKIVTERLQDVGMDGTQHLYPSQLSGGMQKRVGLARALALEPSVLLYDEPTSGLDPVIARTIDDLILETRDRLGMTSIIVSHDIASIFRIADHIVMLADGELLVYGTPDEIRACQDERVIRFVNAA